MKKLIFLIVLCFISNYLPAKEIILSCNINLTSYFSTGGEEKEYYQEHIKISEIQTKRGIERVIEGMSNKLLGVGSVKMENRVINDFSSDTEWFITNNWKPPKQEHTASYRINRYSGRMTYSSFSSFNSGNSFLNKSGDGTCEIIDTTKKKF